ncbi:MAG: hypothetical protein FJZ95_06230 [Chloroflexi bacterium]|nr:hypothetical protein [Chloroflexota bacterium]
MQVLEDVGIEYMLTGSVVSSLQGEPRSTHDIDIVVAIPKRAAKALVQAFPSPRFYLEEESIRDAIDKNGMFNLIDTSSGDKVDFWVLTGEPFDRARFSRKYAEDVLGMRIVVSKPEDTILMKLRWAALSGGSEKQFTDALRVYEVQFGKLDIGYLHRWATELGLESMVERLQKEAEII